MGFLELLYTVLIGPILLLYELVFALIQHFVVYTELSIIFLSLFINILILPLYKRADALQAQARDMEDKLRRGRKHIKKTFSGDEKMMMLHTYYRQNDYRPVDMLKGSVSLLLEIPFFIAAYQFLTAPGLLDGCYLGPIEDFAAPDALLNIGGVTINVLPFIMTAINLLSAFIYLKGFPRRDKIQLYGMALLFLVLLYHSPSGLVIYWIFNNLFSLGKNIVYRIRPSEQRKETPVTPKTEPDRRFFIICSLFLTVLAGLLIPSNLIADSPQEFIDFSYYYHPCWYLAGSLAMAAGVFLVWLQVVYGLLQPAAKVFLEKMLWVMCGLMLINYMFFGTDMGIISNTLCYENEMEFSHKEQLVNVGVLVFSGLLLYFLAHKWRRELFALSLTLVFVSAGMSVLNIVVINQSLKQLAVAEQSKSEDKILHLDTVGENVVVIMLDKAMGSYIPYIMNEKPELREQFAGFTYYSNVVSFGGNTNIASPALFGGYEYTPVEMNRRADEPLVSKHNEALKLMPVLFLEQGYDVTVCDPTYANYQWIPDLSVFDEYPDIHSYITMEQYGDGGINRQTVQNNQRNFFWFSMMKMMPLCLQPFLYTDGTYRQQYTESEYNTQVTKGISQAWGKDPQFLGSYHVLDLLPNMTKITNKNKNTYLFLSNDMTHDVSMLQEPQYVPAQRIDNTEYDTAHADRFVFDGRTMKVEYSNQMAHYHSNMAAMILLGKWFDFLRSEGVYDNTRIIIVADHGAGLKQLTELVHKDESGETVDVELFFPCLLVKDFDRTGFRESDEFMTNADVPLLAMDGLIEHPVNPFTGKPLTDAEKYAHDQYILRPFAETWKTDINDGNTFMPSKWASVRDNIWNADNWEFNNKEMVLDKYEFP